MLDGQGADEILGGYHTHLESRLASLIRQGRCLSAINLLTGISSQPNFHLRDLLFSTAGFFLPFQLQALPRKLLGKDLCPPWLNATWFLDRGVAFQISEKPAGRELFKKHLYQTLSHTVLPMLLRYEDRNSMCHSVESRVPFLTPTFIEFIFGLPDEYILSKDGESKSVFRKAMRGIVPDQVLDRKDKVGFLTPEKEWLISVQRWCEKLFQSETTHHIGALNQEVIRREFQLFLNQSKDSNLPIWRLVNLIRWATRFDVAFV
jgi:asparagine synthase (glutamine-hydrolysing)